MIEGRKRVEWDVGGVNMCESEHWVRVAGQQVGSVAFSLPCHLLHPFHNRCWRE